MGVSMARKSKHPDAGVPPPDTYEKPPQAEWIGPWQVRVRWRKKGMPSVSKVCETWEEAWAWYEAKSAEFTLRGTIADKKESERTTLGEAFDLWVQSGEAGRRRGEKQILQRIDQLKREPFSAHFVGLIRLMDLQAWVDHRSKAGASPSTINNEIAILSNVFKYLATRPGFDGLANPTRGLRKPRARPGRRVSLTEEQEARLFEVIDNRKKIRTTSYLGDLARIAVLTAMREGEIRDLRWDDIHLDEGWLHVREAKSVNGSRTRDVPLTPDAVSFLKALKERSSTNNGSEKIFPFDIDVQVVASEFTKCARRAGLKDFHFHDLRHIAATRLSKIVSNPLTLSEFTGHKTLHVLKTYYNPDASDLADMVREIVEKRERGLDMIVTEIDDPVIVAAIRDVTKLTGERVDTLIMKALRATFVSP
jgi:integrase